MLASERVHAGDYCGNRQASQIRLLARYRLNPGEELSFGVWVSAVCLRSESVQWAGDTVGACLQGGGGLEQKPFGWCCAKLTTGGWNVCESLLTRVT